MAQRKTFNVLNHYNDLWWNEHSQIYIFELKSITLYDYRLKIFHISDTNNDIENYVLNNI